MRLAAVILLALTTLLSGADKKRNPPKPPDIEVLELSVHRAEGRVNLDGRVKNRGLKPLLGLVLHFDFLASGNQVITTRQGPIEQERLEPGEEAEVRAHIVDPVRAVHVRVNAQDGQGRELRVEKPGPYPIE